MHDFGEKDEGLAMLREAVELKPEEVTISVLAAQTDNIEEKEKLAKKVLAENPQHVEALRNLAHAKYFQNEYEEAECIIDKILLKEPNNYLVIEFKGHIYFDRKEYDNALSQYLKIKLNPKPFSLQLRICHCYYLLGMISKAKKIAKKIQGKFDRVYNPGKDVESINELLSEILNS